MTQEMYNTPTYAERAARIRKACAPNFTNRMMFMLAGIEDLATLPEHKADRHYIDLAELMIMPELIDRPNEPSLALAAMAFNGSFRPQDYEQIVLASRGASKDDLRTFLSCPIDFTPRGQVADYLTFPMVVLMTKHLPDADAVDILLENDRLIKKCLPKIRAKTLVELMNPHAATLLQKRADEPLRQALYETAQIPASWTVSISGMTTDGLFNCMLDLRTVQAAAHWSDVKKARKEASQTGYAAKIARWERTHPAWFERNQNTRS